MILDIAIDYSSHLRQIKSHDLKINSVIWFDDNISKIIEHIFYWFYIAYAIVKNIVWIWHLLHAYLKVLLVILCQLEWYSTGPKALYRDLSQTFYLIALSCSRMMLTLKHTPSMTSIFYKTVVTLTMTGLTLLWLRLYFSKCLS